jgi:hypothetical protein
VVVRTYELEHDEFYNDKSSILAGMAGDANDHQSILSAADWAGKEEVEPWVDEGSVSPLTCERKRAASTETGSESPLKRTLPLRGLETRELSSPRDD